MQNSKGKTVQDRISEDILYAKNVEDTEKREVLAVKVLGAVDMAVEFNLIAFSEWEEYITEIFAI